MISKDQEGPGKIRKDQEGAIKGKGKGKQGSFRTLKLFKLPEK